MSALPGAPSIADCHLRRRPRGASTAGFLRESRDLANIVFTVVNISKRDLTLRYSERLDSNTIRTYDDHIVIEETVMHRSAVQAANDFVEMFSLAAFLTMIALVAKAFGA